MAKYYVNFSCGHEERIELFGKIDERNRKISWFEDRGTCSECYKKQLNETKSVGCEPVKMKYSEYKNNYKDCKTQTDSYDAKEKTIIVFVKKEENI